MELEDDLAGKRRLGEGVAVLAVVEQALLALRVKQGADTLLHRDQISSQNPPGRYGVPALCHEMCCNN
jgi:hypothetical protein